MFFTKCVLKTFLRGHKTSKQKIPELLEKSAEKHGFCNSKWAERSAIHPHPSEASFGKKGDIFRIFCFLMFSLFLFLFCSTFYKMLITFDLMLLKLIRGHVGSLKIFKSLRLNIICLCPIKAFKFNLVTQIYVNRVILDTFVC